ncbi:MAG: hypothetical protein HZC01_04320 [Candidatus Kerfeldbacteria bacterium]|nr:hypothetical protein [Candidatus Kerfeldbacteria bacterium]
MRKSIIIPIVLMVVLVVVGAVVWYVGRGDQEIVDNLNTNNSPSAVTNRLANTNTESAGGPVVFTYDIFDVNQVSHITPLGELNGGYNESQAFGGVMINLKRDSQGNVAMLDIIAPADMRLMQYAHYDIEGQPEWALYFSLAPGVELVMHHVRQVSGSIIKATNAVPQDNSRTVDMPIPLAISAGELIGRTTGTSLGHNWNIYVYDESTENTFVRPERYRNNYLGDRMRTASCVFDYYPDTIRQPYQALYGYSAAGQSTTCGTVSRDVTGTVAGLWYFSANPADGIAEARDGDYATPFAAYTASDGMVILHEIDGHRFDIFPNNPTYRKPSDITDAHCYQLVNSAQNSSAGYAYFRVVDSMTMQLAYKSSGSCPASFPATGAVTYYR